jgi:hypothetical protein
MYLLSLRPNSERFNGNRFLVGLVNCISFYCSLFMINPLCRLKDLKFTVN